MADNSGSQNEDQEELIRRIKDSPSTTIYGVSRYSQQRIKQSLALSLILLPSLAIIILLVNQTLIAVLSSGLVLAVALILVGFFSYLNHSHKYFKIYVSDLGIAKETRWQKGAMPWESVEFIEVKFKREEIDYIVFRSGTQKLGYRSSYLACRLTLDIISEYIGGIESWHIIDDINEITEADLFYMRPDIPEAEGLKKLKDLLLMEWVGEQDFDAGQTQEHISAKTDDDLYRMILADPRSICLKDSGSFWRAMCNCKTVLVLLILAIALVFYGMSLRPYSIWPAVLSILIFVIMFAAMFKGDEKLVISSIGIARFIMGSPEAIEWKHVEYIDFAFEGDQLVQVEFFGNKRRVFCPQHTYKGKFTLNLIREYLPEIDSWERMTRPHWDEGTYRLIRPEP